MTPKTYKGNVEINSNNKKEWIEKLKDIEIITGYLSIYSNAELKALKSVGGDLSIYSNAELKALKSVGGDLSIYSKAELKADSLKSVGGDLSIYSNAELKALKSVGGYLYIYSNAELKALKSVGGYLYIYSNAELKADSLKSVGGYLSINSNAELKALKSVGGYLSINSKAEEKLAIRLYKNNRNNEWRLTNNSPEYLLNQKINKVEYSINNVSFDKEWFDKIRKDELLAEEVFAIDNIEHRRIAYEFMDKSKMSQLKDFKVLDDQIDEKGNKMRIVSFNVQNMSNDLKFYNCFCPTTKREYYIGTNQDTCKKAKSMSFGFEEIKFVEEY